MQPPVVRLQSSDGSGGQPDGLVNIQAADYPADNPPTEVSLDDALAKLDALETPNDVPPALFQQLKNELAAQLYAKGVNKIVSTPPTGEANKVTDLEITDDGWGNCTLTWHYRNRGDYDQNGVVGISDITPIAMHYGENTNATNEWVDGTSDTVIDIADITPLAIAFFNEVAGYSIRGGDSPEGEFAEICTALFSTAENDGVLSFVASLPANGFKFVAVAPFDRTHALGDLSNVVERNLPPVAHLTADPTSGHAPLTVNFDAGASSDPDGSIETYDYDWEGNGSYELFDGGPTPTHSYDEDGVYNATVRVTDDKGSTNTASISINLIKNLPPAADVTASRTNGNAPLTVDFDASGSNDPDGSIVKYEWDWEGNGTYDYDSGGEPNASNGFNAGVFHTTVRATDDDGSKATANVTIRVNAPPVAHLRGDPLEGYLPLTVSFSAAESSDSDGTINVFGWDFDGDSDWDEWTLLPDTQHVYTEPGTYTAVVLVTDDWGGQASASVQITVTVGAVQWIHTWGRDLSDYASGIALDASGNAYAAGCTDVYGAAEWDDMDVLLVKYGPEGNLEWKKTWGRDGLDTAYAVAADGNSDVYVSGYANYYGQGRADALLLKYSSTGDLLWTKTCIGSVGERGATIKALAVEGDGNLYGAGDTASFGAGGCDTLLVKYSSDGELLWARAWGGSSGDLCHAVALDGTGNVYLAGYSCSFSAGLANYDVLLLKYSSSGDLIWAKTWGGTEADSGIALAVDEAGNAYVAGRTESFGSGNDDLLLLKYDSDGNLLWVKTWGEGDLDRAVSVAIVGEDLYLGGYSSSFGGDGLEAVLLKYSTNGDFCWANRWGKGAAHTTIYDLVSDSSGILYACGRALNASGGFEAVEGTMSLPFGSEETPEGLETPLNGEEDSPTGVDDTPEGVEDTGGGGTDVLVMKIDPSKL